MARSSVRTLAASRLRKSAPLSLKRDIFGIYGDDHPQRRSLKAQLNLVENKPFVRVALVRIKGASNSRLQEDLDSASLIYQNECDAWVYCVGSITVERQHLQFLDQDDFLANEDGHSVSPEEDELFSLGRNLGANIVGYYIFGVNTGNPLDDGAVAGAAAYPPGRRGFWTIQSHDDHTQWSFAHELTHVVGNNRHNSDTDNLMFRRTLEITNPPPSLNTVQRDRILRDPDMEYPGQR